MILEPQVAVEIQNVIKLDDHYRRHLRKNSKMWELMNPSHSILSKGGMINESNFVLVEILEDGILKGLSEIK